MASQNKKAVINELQMETKLTRSVCWCPLLACRSDQWRAAYQDLERLYSQFQRTSTNGTFCLALPGLRLGLSLCCRV